MNSDSPHISRRKWMGTILGLYVSALLITLLLYTGITLTSGHFNGEIFWLIAGGFPAGLFILFINDGEWVVLAGYAVYIVLAVAGLVFGKRAILLVLLIILVVNIAGCVKVIMSCEENDWRCDAIHSPTTNSTVFDNSRCALLAKTMS